MQVRKQQLELDMIQQTGSKSGKEYVKPVFGFLSKKKVNNSALWGRGGGQFLTEDVLNFMNVEQILDVSFRANHNHDEMPFHSISVKTVLSLAILSFGEDMSPVCSVGGREMKRRG